MRGIVLFAASVLLLCGVGFRVMFSRPQFRQRQGSIGGVPEWTILRFDVGLILSLILYCLWGWTRSR